MEERFDLPKGFPTVELLENKTVNAIIYAYRCSEIPGQLIVAKRSIGMGVILSITGQELYRKGNSEEEFMNILQKNMQPVYDSARRQGYEVWNRG